MTNTLATFFAGAAGALPVYTSMLGTFINFFAILAGGAVGLAVGRHLSDRVTRILMQGAGLTVIFLGFQMLQSEMDPIVVLGSLLIGGVVGEWMDIEGRLERLGNWAEQRFRGGGKPFTRGFLTASLLFITGPMAILGAFQDGLHGDYTLLLTKAMLDGVTSIAFASAFGFGVLFAAIPVLVYQGILTLAAAAAAPWLTDSMIEAITSVGGLLILGLAFQLLQIAFVGQNRLRVGNLTPALAVAVVLTWLTA